MEADSLPPESWPALVTCCIRWNAAAVTSRDFRGPSRSSSSCFPSHTFSGGSLWDTLGTRPLCCEKPERHREAACRSSRWQSRASQVFKPPSLGIQTPSEGASGWLQTQGVSAIPSSESLQLEPRHCQRQAAPCRTLPKFLTYGIPEHNKMVVALCHWLVLICHAVTVIGMVDHHLRGCKTNLVGTQN